MKFWDSSAVVPLVSAEPSSESVYSILSRGAGRDHALKTAGTFQLAAALRCCEGDTDGAGFLCLGDRLRRAASEEGFDVLPSEEAA